MELNDITEKIIGASYEVMNTLGSGFLEKVYQEALEQEFKFRNIPYEREKEFKIKYRDSFLHQTYITDFVCYGKIIIELKAVEEILGIHKAQVINYLNISNMKIGILVNFNSYERITPEYLFPTQNFL